MDGTTYEAAPCRVYVDNGIEQVEQCSWAEAQFVTIYRRELDPGDGFLKHAAVIDLSLDEAAALGRQLLGWD